MGPNGSGKTTILRLLANELTPSQGTIKQADDLKIVYFDQHRAKLPLHLTLREALAPNGDYVYFRGSAIHVNGWCKRFLFSPSSLKMPLEKLSGGERARITIAHLMLQPADVLLLDEPTNDLDIPTLETLEESLIGFPGAVVLITHDRHLLEKTCNLFLSLENGEFFSEFSQWEKRAQKKATASKKSKKSVSPNKKEISYKDKRESKQIEKMIHEEEDKLHKLNASILPDHPEKLASACSEIAKIESHIESLYHRWAELNNIEVE